MSRRARKKRLTLELPDALASSIKQNLKRVQKLDPDADVTEVDVILDALHHVFAVGSERSRSKTRQMLLDKAASHKKKASENLSKGYTSKARSGFLLTAAMEIESLASMNLSRSNRETEEAIKSTLVEVVLLLKAATGYKSLPDLPMKCGSIRTSSV